MDATVIEMPVPQASQTRSTKRGFTLTEIAIVLGIIGLILGAVWSAASGVYANQKASAFTQQMTLYIASIRGACNGSCSSVPAVSQTIPNVNGSGASVTAAPITTGALTGGVQLTYTGIANTTAAGLALCNGLSTAAGATGSSVTFDAAGVTDTPDCNNYVAGGKTNGPECVNNPNPSIYTDKYAGTDTCTSKTYVPTSTCAIGLISGQCGGALYFSFGPSF